ncbi:serine/threonine protein kinase [Blastopirellula marina]|uniref:Serine/threonine protein kinase n=1 Tax=Blastopirellula marina TaxID=124 RepID=A0A2S8F0A2_9BACT|nr:MULTISPECIES: serine/threonine-protein kinase [Pirellulaceae]PQO25598.1 serine/threonine protein kinase [Blastopirellula marina]RCS42562.1 serine/threonine protein kinase [Bremerella cremea]
MSKGQEKSIFFEAIEIESEPVRNVFLQKACGSDQELLASVQALVYEHFREENPVDRLAIWDLESTVGYPMQKAFSFPYEPGADVGPFKLREQIGEGGFGLVFVADQEKPFRRRVALKIIKPGMDSPEVIARFEAERQALALMDHANIARVYDAGMTFRGHPYFVMELVRGVPLIDFCDRHKLTTNERLDLFVLICHAVQYAHQKGIIHRDLKPSNILVSLENGKPVPKIIDFGVAKAINQTLTDRTIYTRYASMIGTPAYMSPEQAEMSNLDIDTRSDIYSLGVLLYEILTGSTPLVQDRVANVGLDELRRIIREEEAQRPSYRLSTLNNELASTISANRRMEPARLTSTVKGDLDWIVMKALNKDRNRRYATAGALAKDVTCYLNQQPIEARPPSSLYRFSKYARRHKIAILATSMVALALILGLVVSAWQASVATIALRDARRAETEATSAKEELEQFTERLKQANSLLTSGYAHVDAGNWAEAHDAYTQAIKVQPRYFPVWIGRGSLYAKLGLWELAADDYQQAFELGSPLDRVEFLGVPQLFLYTDKRSQYSVLRQQLAQVGEMTGGAVSRGVLISQDVSPVEASKIAEAFEGQLTSLDSEKNEEESLTQRKHSRIPMGVRLYVAGWAHLKAGNLKQAIFRLQQSSDDSQTWAGHGIGYPLIAIAYHEQGRSTDAQMILKQAEQQMELWLESSLNGPDISLPIPWFDWIEFLINYDRAQRLINGKTSTPNPKLAQRTSRALAVIE